MYEDYQLGAANFLWRACTMYSSTLLISFASALELALVGRLKIAMYRAIGFHVIKDSDVCLLCGDVLCGG